MQPLSCYSDILGNILRWHDILFYYYYMGRASSSSFFVCVQQSWTTLAGVSPVTVIASEPRS